MGNADPGEDQKTEVVGHETEVLPSGGDIPTDESVSGLNLESRAGPTQASNNLALQKDRLSYMLPDQSGVPQIMILVHQVIPQVPLLRSDQLESGFSMLTEGPLQGSLSKQGDLDKGLRPVLAGRRRGGSAKNPFSSRGREFHFHFNRLTPSSAGRVRGISFLKKGRWR